MPREFLGHSFQASQLLSSQESKFENYESLLLYIDGTAVSAVSYWELRDYFEEKKQIKKLVVRKIPDEFKSL